MGKHVNRTGEIYKTNSSGRAEIIEWFGCTNCTIRFDDGTILRNINHGSLKRGHVSNPNDRFLYGIGYIGVGEYNSRNSPKAHDKWGNMFTRCYSRSYQNRQPTYKGVTICEEWECFQNFAKWFYENYKEGFDLDKDLLSESVKIYSPKTCCFLPKEINAMLSGHGKTIYIHVSKGRYYPTLVIKKKPVPLKSSKSREEALEIFIEAKKSQMFTTLGKYKNQLEDRLVEKIEVYINNYIKY